MSDHADRAHSLFAPSSASRWMRCPASAQANYLAPDEPSPYAEEGTRAHEAAERTLIAAKAGRLTDHTFLEVDRDMIEHVMSYVQWCFAATEGAAEVMIETRVDFSAYTALPNQTGTLDFCAIHSSPVGGHAILCDLKYGTGVRVYAKDNEQMMLYALGVYEAWDWLYEFKRFDLRVCQPRLGVFDEWEISRADLLAFGERVKAQTALALSPDAPLVPGEKQCRFCKVKATCAAQLDLLNQVADDTFEVVEPLTPSRALSLPAAPPSLPPIASLTVEQLARIQHHAKTIKSWLDAGQRRLMAEALADRPVPGWKLVEGRSMRRWRDEDDAVLALTPEGVSAFDRVVISPAEAETRLKAAGMKAKDAKALVAELTVKPPGAPTLVPDSDERPVIDHDDGDVFGVIE